MIAVVVAVHCDESGQYVPDDEGRYTPDNSGEYVPDFSGNYVHDPSGTYKGDGTGGYTAQSSGKHIEKNYNSNNLAYLYSGGTVANYTIEHARDGYFF